MAGTCKAASGLAFSCTDLLKVGGTAPFFWIGYKSDLATQISLLQSADINTLSFLSYGGLRRMEGNKFAHSAGYTMNEVAGGNKNYTHTVAVKVVSDSTADDVILQNFSLGNDMFVIIPDGNENIFIYGAGAGLRVSANTQNTGQTGDSDTTYQVTFEGTEKTMPLRFSKAGGYSASIAYLQSVEI